MSRYDHHLSETDIRPQNAEALIVRADSADSRDWIADAPVCPGLAHHQIRHLAVARMPSPFEIVRTRLGGSYFLACFGGEGRVLVDGRWTRSAPMAIEASVATRAESMPPEIPRSASRCPVFRR